MGFRSRNCGRAAAATEKTAACCATKQTALSHFIKLFDIIRQFYGVVRRRMVPKYVEQANRHASKSEAQLFRLNFINQFRVASPKPTDFTAGFSLPHPNIPAFQEHSSSVPNLFITEPKRETGDSEKNKCNHEETSQQKSAETIRERAVTVSGSEHVHRVQETVSE